MLAIGLDGACKLSPIKHSIREISAGQIRQPKVCSAQNRLAQVGSKDHRI